MVKRNMLLDTKRKRIVVAEDDAAILELISVRLDIAGYHVIAARNGYQTLERIRATRPEGMVLDIGLPGLDGFDVLQEVASCAPGLPVLVLTARRAADDVRKAIGLGAHSYLVKPFDDQALLERVALITTPRRVAPPVSPVEGAAWEV
jgi:DNA-binding response OmpR family regulator